MRPSWFSLLLLLLPNLLMLLSNVVALCVCVCLADWGPQRSSSLSCHMQHDPRERVNPQVLLSETHKRREEFTLCLVAFLSAAAAPIRSCCSVACCSSFFFILLFFKKRRRRRRGDDDDLGLSFLDLFETRRGLKPVQLLFKISLSLFHYIVVSSSHAVTALESWRRGRPFVSFDWRFCLGSNAVKV